MCGLCRIKYNTQTLYYVLSYKKILTTQGNVTVVNISVQSTYICVAPGLMIVLAIWISTVVFGIL